MQPASFLIIFSCFLYCSTIIGNTASNPKIPVFGAKGPLNTTQRLISVLEPQLQGNIWSPSGLLHTVLGEYKYKGSLSAKDVIEQFIVSSQKADSVATSQLGPSFIKNEKGYIALNGGMHTFSGLSNFLAINQAVGKTLKVYFDLKTDELKNSYHLKPQSHNQYQKSIYTKATSPDDADLILEEQVNHSYILHIKNSDLRTKGNAKKTLWPIYAVDEGLQKCAVKHKANPNPTPGGHDYKINVCVKIDYLLWEELFKNRKAELLNSSEQSNLEDYINQLEKEQQAREQKSNERWKNLRKHVFGITEDEEARLAKERAKDAKEDKDPDKTSKFALNVYREAVKRNILTEDELDERLDSYLASRFQGKIAHFDYRFDNQLIYLCKKEVELDIKLYVTLEDSCFKIKSCFPFKHNSKAIQ